MAMTQHIVCVTAPVIAKCTGLSLSTIRKLTRNGKIPHVKIGRRIIYPVSAVNDWLFANGLNINSVKDSVDSED